VIDPTKVACTALTLPALPAHVLLLIVDMDEMILVPDESDAPKIPAEPLPPIQSRFLFVDVAALRAKQLRRGARQRLGEETLLPHKAERVAMEEVKRGLVYYDMPAPKLAEAE
jgi:DNA-directed RNA polymerase omega subunit